MLPVAVAVAGRAALVVVLADVDNGVGVFDRPFEQGVFLGPDAATPLLPLNLARLAAGLRFLRIAGPGDSGRERVDRAGYHKFLI